MLNELDQKELLSIPNEKTPTGLRNKAIIMLALDKGLKSREMINLKWDNIKKGILSFEDKTYLPLQNETQHILNSWKKKQDEELKKRNISTENLYVFTTLEGGQISKSYISQMLSRYSEKAGLEKDVGLKLLREMSNATKDLREVKRELGVQIHPTLNDLKDSWFSTGVIKEPSIFENMIKDFSSDSLDLSDVDLQSFVNPRYREIDMFNSQEKESFLKLVRKMVLIEEFEYEEEKLLSLFINESNANNIDLEEIIADDVEKVNTDRLLDPFRDRDSQLLLLLQLYILCFTFSRSFQGNDIINTITLRFGISKQKQQELQSWILLQSILIHNFNAIWTDCYHKS